MRKRIIEIAVTVAVIAGITGFFIYQGHQREIANSPSYEGNESAIARPVNQDNLQSKLCAVKRVSDGDTIAVDCSGQELKIRFCGIDAPEKAQPLGMDSKALMAKLVEGKKVYVMAIEQDKYGRTVAEVEAVGDRRNEKGETINTFVNAEMVRSGMAYHYKQYSANCPNRELIVEAEKVAKDKKIGVWSGDYQKPWDFRRTSK
jgi:endonuclease YncB( thermonuclease family)